MMNIPGLFITGTDTGVGKTYIAAAIARTLHRQGQKIGVLKPVATGALLTESGWEIDDARELLNAIESDAPVGSACPIAFADPLAPPVAARQVNKLLTFRDIQDSVNEAVGEWRNERGAEAMIVEGVGGFLCPLAEDATIADLAVWLDFPVVIVARRGLGTLNHTLLTIEAVQRRSLRVAAVVFNSPEQGNGSIAETTNPDELSKHIGSIPIINCVAYGSEPGGYIFDKRAVDWYTHVKPPRFLASPA